MRRNKRNKEKERFRSREQRRKQKLQLHHEHSRPSPHNSYSNPLQFLPFLTGNSLTNHRFSGYDDSTSLTNASEFLHGNKIVLTSQKIISKQYDAALEWKTNANIVLNLAKENLTEFLACYQFLPAKHLILRHNSITSFQLTKTMTNLKSINLYDNKLTEFLQEDVVSQLPNLEKLNLNRNYIKVLPEKSLTILSNKLKKLDISYNLLTSLPSYITILENLNRLDVSFNQIKELPVEIAQWKLVENEHIQSDRAGHEFPSSFILKGNKLPDPHQRHFESKGTRYLAEYFKSFHTQLDRSQSTSLKDYLKVVIVGHDGSGKSVIAKALREFHQAITEKHSHNWQPEEESVTITTDYRWKLLESSPVHAAAASQRKGLTPFPPPLKINLWDFMEKDIYQSSMDIFYSKHALHIVVWNVARTQIDPRTNVPNFNEVEYWINLIQAKAPGSTILIVATHTDLITNKQATDLIAKCREYILAEECERMLSLQQEIDNCKDESKKNYLTEMLLLRPYIEDIVTLTFRDNKIYGSEELLKHIVLLTHSSTAMEGSSLLPVANIYESIYEEVKTSLDRLKKRKLYACSIEDLKRDIEENAYNIGHIVLEEEEDDSDKWHILQDKSILKDALTYWMQAGEIVYLFDRNKEEDASFDDTDDEDEVESTYIDIEATPRASLDLNSPSKNNSSTNQPLGSILDHNATDYTDSTSVKDSFKHFNQDVDDSVHSNIGKVEVSEMIFVSPNRFRKALRGVLNKDPREHMSELKKTPLRERAPLERSNSGMHSTTNNTSLDYKNGLVTWKSLIVLLEDSSKCLLSKQYTDDFDEEDGVEKEKERILSFLREVLVYLEVIIPVSLDFGGQLDVGEQAFEFPFDAELEKLYVFPAFLPEADPLSYGVPQYAPSGLIKLEKSFQLPKFAPIALIPKIMAKLLSRNSKYYQNSANMNEEGGGLDKDKCQGFQTCLVQSIGERTLWVFLDHFTSKNDSKCSSSMPLSPSSMKYDQYTHYSSQSSASSSTHYTLRIIIFDYLFSVLQGVCELYSVQDIVMDVLQSYQGLGTINVVAYCPLCLMRQSPYEYCGFITEEQEFDLLLELNALVDKYDKTSPNMQANFVQDEELYKNYHEWEDNKAPICPNKCAFKADFYVPLPDEILAYKQADIVQEEIEVYLWQKFIGNGDDKDEKDTEGDISSEANQIGAQCSSIAPAAVKLLHLVFRSDSLVRLKSFLNNGSELGSIEESLNLYVTRGMEYLGVSLHIGDENRKSYFIYAVYPENPDHPDKFHSPVTTWFLAKVGDQYHLYSCKAAADVCPTMRTFLLEHVCGVQPVSFSELSITLCLDKDSASQVPAHSLLMDANPVRIEESVLVYTGQVSPVLERDRTSLPFNSSQDLPCSLDVREGGQYPQSARKEIVYEYVLGRIVRHVDDVIPSSKSGRPSSKTNKVDYYVVNSYAGNPQPGSPVFRTHSYQVVGVVAPYRLPGTEFLVGDVFGVIPTTVFFTTVA